MFINYVENWRSSLVFILAAQRERLPYCAVQASSIFLGSFKLSSKFYIISNLLCTCTEGCRCIVPFSYPPSAGEVLPVYSTSDGHMVTLVKEHTALPASSYNVSTSLDNFGFITLFSQLLNGNLQIEDATLALHSRPVE
jgi:hypothetical protein